MMGDIGGIISSLRAAVEAFNAGGSGDALAGRVTELADELDGHECIGQEEAEHIHDVAMWERQWGKRQEGTC